MARKRLVGPVGGVANNSTAADTPANFAPPGAMSNVNLVGAKSRRPRLGRRAGMKYLVPQQMGTGANHVQCLTTVDVPASTSEYQRQSCARWSDWQTRPVNTLTGGLWLLESNTAMFGSIKALGTMVVGDPHYGWYTVAWQRRSDGRWNVIFTGLARRGNPGPIYTPVYCYRADTAELQWQAFLDDRNVGGTGSAGSVDIFANAIRVSGSRMYVPTTAGYVYVIDATTPPASPLTPLTTWTRYTTGWADEVMDVWPDAADQRLHAVFMGSGVVTGDVTTAAHLEGWWYRAGIASWSMLANGSLLQNTLSTGGENNHGTLRFSSVLQRQPRGMIPWGFVRLSAARNNDYVVIGTNRGWNATGSLPPNSDQAPTTVVRISQQGYTATTPITRVWERDTYSRLDPHIVTPIGGGAAITIYNDIPAGIPGNNTPVGSFGPGGPESSLNAIAVDRDDNLYVGGRTVGTPLGNRNVFSLSPDGDIRWSAALGDATVPSGQFMNIHQHCIVVDPTDQNIWVGGKRNGAWTGNQGNQAHLWKLSRDTGQVIQYADLNVSDRNVYGLAVNEDGQVAYVTEGV